MAKVLSMAHGAMLDLGHAVEGTARNVRGLAESLGLGRDAPPGPGAAWLAAIEREFVQAGRPFTDQENPGLQRAGNVTGWCRPKEITRHEGRALSQGPAKRPPSRGPSKPSKFFPMKFPPVCGAIRVRSGSRRRSMTPRAMAPRAAMPQPPPLANWELFRGELLASDVEQGELGDCWFLSALAALAEVRQGLFIRQLFPQQDRLSPAGAYVVRLCLGGQWRGILVDDRLPCMDAGKGHKQLAYCVTHRMQLWASLIEKAYAKACGSYQATVGGESGEALSILTGCPCELIRFVGEDFHPEQLWRKLCGSRDSGFLMTCSTTTCSVKASWLQAFHVYSLLGVYEESVPGKGRVRLVKIQNPNRLTKWQGAWSESSSQWTPQLRQKLCREGGGDSRVFFMEFGDFLKQFAHCTICRLQANGWEERKQVSLAGGGQYRSGVSLRVSAKTDCSVSLVQPDERLARAPGSAPLIAAGFVVLQQDGNSVVEVARVRRSSHLSVDCRLSPEHSYLVVPLSLHSGPPAAATVACVSAVGKPVTLQERRVGVDLSRRAWMEYARRLDREPVRFRDAVLRVAKGEGGYVVVVAENHGAGYLQVEYTIASNTLRFSRGQSATRDWLPPKHAMLLQFGSPIDPSGSSSWQSSHKFQLVMQPPSQALHQPPLPAGDLHAPFRL